VTSKAPESTQEVTIPDASTVWRPSFPVSLRLTLATLGHGGFDPCHRWQRDGSLWRTSRLPSGPVSYRLKQLDRGEIGAAAWGPGAAELIASVPTLLGADDDPESFEPRHEVLRQAHRRAVGMRIPQTGRVLESLIPAVLEQKVIGLDAFAAWQRLVTKYGEDAPGPVPRGMKLAPTAATWRRIPSWEWHRAGVEHKRASTAIRCATYAEKFDRAATTLPRDGVYRLLMALPGVGRWTAAEVGHRVLGDADAVPLGDYHLPDVIGFGLTGKSLPEDEVEEFLEPWRPHRYRVFRLLELTPGAGKPRRAPRMTRRDYRRI
jgi:3-methyladenine DNA glycosylase/8-oxoguanine DNA glycosylase